MTSDLMEIYYDGSCPFCSQFVQLLRLRETVGTVELINVRESAEARHKLTALGYDLDEGMVAHYRGAYYHGHECVRFLAMLSTDSTVFNRLNRLALGGKRRARMLYPVLRAGRNTVLRLLGVAKINAST